MAVSKDPSFSGRRPRAQNVRLKSAAERRIAKQQGLDRTSTSRIAKGTPPQGTPPQGRRLQKRSLGGLKYNRDVDARLQKAVRRRLTGS